MKRLFTSSSASLVISLLAASCLSVLCLAQTTAPPATTSDPTADIAPLWAYAGTWQVTIDHFDTAHSKASHEQTNLRNACWKDGGYVACNQYVDGDSKVLIVFTYSGKNGIYASYQVPRHGEEPGTGKLFIEGNTWTFPWQAGEGDKTTYFRVVNVFLTPDKIDFRQEFSTDGVHWTAMAHGTEIRVKGA
jgi:hypothetical protein